MQTADMNEDLADKWRQRLLHLQAQLADAPRDLGAWHWRAEIRVLRFLVSRYGCDETPAPAKSNADICIEPALDEPTLLHMSALQRALVKMALITPRVQTKHPRPTERDRAAMLERLKEAGDKARDISDEEERRLKQFELTSYFALVTRRNNAQQRDREIKWKRHLREQERERKER